ncbi:MAG: retention module-containing protein [Methylotenera sp.]|nr:retention module-containing protein [Methylotenera sp.]
MALIGKIVAITGNALLISNNGDQRELRLGDSIQTADTIKTPAGVEVQLELANGRIVHIGAEQLVAFADELGDVFVPEASDSAIDVATIDTVIKAIEEGKDINEVLEDTAAGVGGSSNSYGFGFVDLLRINDDLNNFKFAYEYNTDSRLESDPAAIIDDASNGLQAGAGAPLAPVNTPPVATPLAIGNAEGSGSVSGNLVATDANGDTLNYSPVGLLPPGLVLNPDGSFTFDYSNPAYNILAAGVPQVLVVPYLVSDGKGGTSTSALTITVTGTNDAPVATAAAISPIEDTPISVPLLGTDVDGTIASFTITAGPTPAQGTLVYDDDGLPGTPAVAVPLNTALTPTQAATVQFVPTLNYNGSVDPVTFTVTDNDGLVSPAATVTINPVIAVNDAPIATDNSNSVAINGSATGNVLTDGIADSDPDLDTLMVTSFSVDTNGDSVPETFVAGAPAVIAGVGTLSIGATGVYTFTPLANYAGSIPVATYTISDGSTTPALTDIATLTLTMGNNTPPVATDDINAVVEDTPTTGNVLTDRIPDSDVDSNPLSVTGFSIDTNGDSVPEIFTAGQTANITGIGTLTIGSTGAYTFTPTLNYTGPIPVATYAISDGLGGTDTATLTLGPVSPVNDLPVAVLDTATVAEDGSLVITAATLMGNDTNLGDGPVTITSVQSPVNGTVTLVGTTVTFTPTANYFGPASFTYTITDANGDTSTATVDVTVVPTPTLSIGDVTVVENIAGGFATFTVTLSAVSGQTVTVGYNTTDGTAIAGTDYTGVAGTVTFTPGQTTQTITVPITNDTLRETSETFYVNLVSPTNATVADALGVGVIIDNDPIPSISLITAATENEGVALVHTVTLSNLSSVATNFSYTLGGGTASSGTDYNATPIFSNGVTLSGGFLTVPAGVGSFTITVPSIQDTIDEGLSETYNLTVGGVTAVGTITDDDVPPTITVGDVSVSEVAGNYAIFSVDLSVASGSTITSSLTLADVTATGGSGTGNTIDYRNNQIEVSYDNGATWIVATSVTFAAGETSALVRVLIRENSNSDVASETFTLTATTTDGITFNPSDAGTATIVERDLTLRNTLNPTVTEGSDLIFDYRATASTVATTYSFSLSGTAANGADYGTITSANFSGGVTFTQTLGAPNGTGTITVPSSGANLDFRFTLPTINDTLDESAETVVVNAGGLTRTGTINDNDATPSLTINDVTVNEAAGIATFTVTLSAASGQNVSVNYNTSSVTALSGIDFSAASGTLSFAPGEITKTITVNIANDIAAPVYEGAETFRVNLSTPVNATIADNFGVGTIVDNGTGAGGTDNDTPTFNVSNITVSDQAAGFATFVVSLSNASSVATVFNLALTNGTATGAGVDYGAAGATNLQVSTDNGAT